MRRRIMRGEMREREGVYEGGWVRLRGTEK
jgi:hypothetical protein